MQYMNAPQFSGVPMDFVNQPQVGYMNPPAMPQQLIVNQPQGQQQKQKIDPRVFDTPEITMGDSNKRGGLFTVTKDQNANMIVVDTPIPDAEVEKKKKGGRPKKSESPDSNTKIITSDNSSPEKVNGVVEDMPTAYTYMETTGLLRETLGQIDSLNGELVQEFEAVRQNRTMKNKYNVLVGISENIGSLIGNRIQAIKEINNSITKANDLDYKKLKDVKAAQAVMNDDKYIADVYQALISNQQNLPANYNMPPVDSSLYGSGIVRTNITDSQMVNNGVPMDVGYLNYIANMTPEQTLMMYEGNPNIQQVVVYDAASGAKMFKMMDISTGQVIENVPTYDETIMEDTTLDIKNRIAKNINLNETFKIIVINDDITSQY